MENDMIKNNTIENNCISYINGQLEINHLKGKIYFHIGEENFDNKDSNGNKIELPTILTILRICNLPTPIPNPLYINALLDIIHLKGCSWTGIIPITTTKTKLESGENK